MGLHGQRHLQKQGLLSTQQQQFDMTMQEVKQTYTLEQSAAARLIPR
jgi:hypothetical protein